MRTAVVSVFLVCAALTLPAVGSAQEVGNYMCDPGLDDCRARVIALIDAETQAIDVAFWFMEDTRFSQALVRAKNRGVDVRAVVDSRAWGGGDTFYPGAKVPIDQLYAAGIPIRHKTGGSGILHFKMMLFYGQNMLQFSGANYSDVAFVREGYPTSAPYSAFVDETIVFTNDDALLQSFMTKFDDIWTDTTTGSQAFANYCPTPIPTVQAGCTTRTLTRRYPAFPLDPEMNFVPWNNFSSRSVGRYNAETTANGGGIDAIMYRITDASHTQALIRAARRGVPVRLITEQLEYRNPNRFWNSYNFDLLYLEGQKCAATPSLCAGTGSIAVRFRNHPGLLHEKLTVLRGQQMAIVGSSNWTSASASGQHEHNLFATRAKRPWAYDWAVDHFNHKWTVLSDAMVPEPPDAPVLKLPANTAQNQPQTVTLKWNAGLWGMKYQVRLGTSPTDLAVVASNLEFGPSQSSSDLKSFTVSNLSEGTTYYWQIVSSTMADLSRTSPVWSFRTTGGAPPPGAPSGDVVMHAYRAPIRAGWTVTTDATAAGGRALSFANDPSNLGAGLPKRAVQAAPTDYFEIGFTADAGVPYRLWMRGKAHANRYENDSAFVQFSDSVTATGTAQWRIGTTSAAVVTLEDCTGCATTTLSGWVWNDTASTATPGALGPLVYFSSTGTHRIRVQVREDGVTFDQIMLVRAPTDTTPAPGSPRDDATIYPEQGVAPVEGAEEPPPPTCGTLPAGWSSQDIGGVTAIGQSCFNTTTQAFTISGSGADIWGTADQFQFAYKQMTGDGTITVHVAQLSPVDRWTKTGVMMRESLSDASAHASMFVSGSMGMAFQRRVATAGVTTHTAGPMASAPYWVRLQRVGDVFSASASTDGSSWTLIGTQTITMSPTIFVGVPLTSHLNGSTATATASNVSVTTP